MSLYAVKNDKGEYLNGVAGEKPLFGGLDKYCVLNGKDAGWWACRGYGKVIELVEKPAPVVVSEAEAEMLEGAKKQHNPAWYIGINVDGRPGTEDRLMRAYVNGWTVEKPKRYVLPMPYGADDDDPDDSPYAAVNREYYAGPAWYQGPCVSFKEAREHYSVTQVEIDAAPAWVKAITPVEVTDDEQ